MMNRSPFLAAVLSFVAPGAGQLYNGQRAKGVVVLCMVLGLTAAVAMATIGPARMRSSLTVALLGFVYLFVWIPAIIGAWQDAAGTAKPLLSGERRWYVILMLLSVGPGAIPLLWSSGRFSRIAKLLWTLAVIGIFGAGIYLALVVVPVLEQHYGDVLRAFEGL